MYSYSFVQVFVGSVMNFVTGGFLFLSGYCYFNALWNQDNFSWKKAVQVHMYYKISVFVLYSRVSPLHQDIDLLRIYLPT